MNLKSIVYFSLFGLTCINANAQNSSDELLRINNIPFTVGEFERIYTKNLDLIKDEDQKNIDNYLDLFVLYKLKVAKAYELGLDKEKEYLSEFNTHRTQLAEQYLTNEETLKALTKEAYERSKYEIKASHIIFLADELASPSDTLKAYNKAIEARKEIVKGKSFGEAAKLYSEDPNAVNNLGELGYFSVLRMVYPFETAAYNTPVGEVSQPIRTQFGYHLIHVEDKRLRKGKRDIAHIIIENKDSDDLAKNKIDKVYDLLQSGSSFENLALEYSDDESSKTTGGAFASYEPGTLNIIGIDETVNSLNKVGDYSKPFKSQFGWHIIKLNAIQDIASFADSEQFLLRKVQSDNRSRIINDELITFLKKKYQYKENTANVNQFVKSIEKEIVKPDWKPENNPKKDKVLATFANQKITSTDLEKNIYSNQFYFQNSKSLNKAIQASLNDLAATQLKKYYNDNLESEFPEFKNTAQEFKEGLLLFDLMENEIWQKVKTDSLGYTNYYKTNSANFIQKASIEGKIIQADKKGDIKQIAKFEKANFGKPENGLMPKLDPKSFQTTKGTFTINEKRLPKNYVLKEGVSEIFEENGKYYIVVANQYIPEKIADLEDVKQNVIYEYQQEFEKQWLNDLKNDAKIQINKETLKQLKTKYKQN